MMMAAAQNPYYMQKSPKREISDEEKRAKAKALYPMDMSEREFIIHGEKIMAKNRKTALKIYALRHKKGRTAL